MLLLSEEKYLRINISRINDHKKELALENRDEKKKKSHSYIENAFHNNVCLDCFYISKIIAYYCILRFQTFLKNTVLRFIQDLFRYL